MRVRVAEGEDAVGVRVRVPVFVVVVVFVRLLVVTVLAIVVVARLWRSLWLLPLGTGGMYSPGGEAGHGVEVAVKPGKVQTAVLRTRCWCGTRRSHKCGRVRGGSAVPGWRGQGCRERMDRARCDRCSSGDHVCRQLASETFVRNSSTVRRSMSQSKAEYLDDRRRKCRH